MTNFNVGDRVRYTGRHPRGVMSANMIGRIGTIHRDIGGAFDITWDNYYTDRSGWLPANLELITSNSLRTLWSAS